MQGEGCKKTLVTSYLGDCHMDRRSDRGMTLEDELEGSDSAAYLAIPILTSSADDSPAILIREQNHRRLHADGHQATHRDSDLVTSVSLPAAAAGTTPLRENRTKRPPSEEEEAVEFSARPLGNSRYILGQLFWAADSSSSIVVAIIVLVTVIFFTVAWSISKAEGAGGSSETSEEAIWVIVTLISWLLALFVLAFLFLTVFTSPGVVPKALGRSSNRPADGLIAYVELPSGVKLYKPYCYVCNINRPPRAAHCPLCNNCVERYDHHCGLIGACIGKGNFTSFVRFVGTTLVLACWLGGWSVFLSVKIFELPTLSAAEDVAVVLAIIVAGMSFVTSALLLRMVWYQFQASCRGLTQREYVKLFSPDVASDKNKMFDPTNSNPYDAGTMANLVEMCC